MIPRVVGLCKFACVEDEHALVCLGCQAEGGKDRKDKTIEERYQKKTLREHVLTRPDSYVGSCKRHEDELWVHDGEKMVFKTVSIVPALYKIFDEILVNAADNKVNDPSMDEIRVVIDVVS